MILFCWPQTSQNFCQAPSQRPWHCQQGWDPISRHHLFPTMPSCQPICFISSFGHLQGLMMGPANHANQSVSSLQLLLYKVWWWALERGDLHLGTQAKLEVCFIHSTFRERKTKRAIELLDKTPTHILRPLTRMISTSLYWRFGGNEQKRGP